VDPPDGFENRRVTAFVIIRSGGASSGAVTTDVGTWGGGVRNGLKRLGQSGPVNILLPAGTRVDKAAPQTSKAIAAIAMVILFSPLIA
jgi:hypothetical protein